jgi:hypothetical protein
VSIVNAMADDPIIQRIESFRCRRGQLFAEHRNRGYTIYRASSGALVARLRPTGQDDRVEVLYWSLWKERWARAGPFGRTVLPLDQALKFIAPRTSFGLSDSNAFSPKMRKSRDKGGHEGTHREVIGSAARPTAPKSGLWFTEAPAPGGN